MKTHRSSLVFTSSRVLVSSAALGCFCFACQSESVDLGGDTVARNLASAALCAESARLDADVIVSNQEELEALAGCEEVGGDLLVLLFEGADLTPLAALRVVEGDFALGLDPGLDAIAGFLISDRLDPQRELIERGWLASLDGVQALESVGALFLRGLPDADLSAFSSLSSVGSVGSDIDGFLDGQIILQQNENLRSLAGLESVRDARGLVVTLSPALTSLDGFAPTDRLRSVSLFSSPLLSDLTALSTLSSLDFLTVSQTGAVDLNALAGLRTLEELALSENAELVDATGLEALESAERISITSNAALARLPSFASFTAQPNIIQIGDNAALESVTLDFANAETPTYAVRGFPSAEASASLLLGVGVIDIRSNRSLQTISVASGVTLARLLMIGDNPALQDIDLGSLDEVGHLIIAGNAALTTVRLGELQAVSLLQVTNNSRLSSTVFDELLTFNRLVFDNAD
jgi:hypothetical protein